jgi:hypothetical protein
MSYMRVSEPSKTVVLQIEDRVDPFFEACMARNKQYCDLHGYRHMVVREGVSWLPPYWWKVAMVEELMSRKDVDNAYAFDYVVWMDSDSFVHDPDTPVRHFFKDSASSMVVCPDPPGWGSDFMAAVFMIKNDAVSRSMMRTWMSFYNLNNWEKDVMGGGWKYVGQGAWAGVDYEQGAFASYILPNPCFRKSIKSLPWHTFHEIDCDRPSPGCWSVHIPGAVRERRPSCARKIPRRMLAKNRDRKHAVASLVVAVMCLICAGLAVAAATRQTTTADMI